MLEQEKNSDGPVTTVEHSLQQHPNEKPRHKFMPHLDGKQATVGGDTNEAQPNKGLSAMMNTVDPRNVGHRLGAAGLDIAASGKQFAASGMDAASSVYERVKKLSPVGDMSKQQDKEKPKKKVIEARKCFKLLYPQPLHPAQPDRLVEGLQLNMLKYLLFGSVACYLVGWLQMGYAVGLLSVASIALAYWMLGQETQSGLNFQLEKTNGTKSLFETEGETVEWLNYMVEKIWRSIDPRMFAAVEDILEDTLSSVVPSVIKGVAVTDFDIGVNAPRIQNIRIFPPVEGQPAEAMYGQVAFSLQASPDGSSSHPIASMPPSIAIRFKTGIKAPIDIKAELTKLLGQVRFKIMTAPDMPFVSKVTISFVSAPIIDTGVMPLSKHLNVMRLPMMHSLVNEAVKLGFAGFVDPKSITIDVKDIMGAASQDTSAIGVIAVEMRGAERDSSIPTLEDLEDSYATLQLSHQDHTHAPSTRVLTNDKNPSWNEMLYLLIHQDDIVNEDTTVQIKVWDADKVKFDDEWGTVSLPVRQIVQGQVNDLGIVVDYAKEERVVFDGWAPVDGESEDNPKMRFNFKMSFHPKYVSRTPKSLLFGADEKHKTERQKHLEQEQVQPAHKSGILSVQITQATELEIGDPAMLTDEEFKHPYSPNQTVTPYAELYINDLKVFKTRPKMNNPNPYWNALSEHFIRDFDTAFVRISVKTSFDLEHDPVLGTKVFFLKDMFAEQEDKFKEAERWFPLVNGIGFGKIQLSLKYKPVKLSLLRELQGSDVGTLVIDRITFSRFKSPFSPENTKSTRATLALNIDPTIIRRLKPRDIVSETKGDGYTGWAKRRLYFPITMRYRTALYVNLTQGTITTHKATGRVWLKTMIDNAWQEVTVGLHEYHAVNSAEANRNEDDWAQEGPYGQVTIRMKLIPGFSPVHTHLQSFEADMIGADPFRDDSLAAKSLEWHDEQHEMDQELQVTKARRSSSQSEASNEYDVDNHPNNEQYLDEMQDLSKNQKIAKYQVLRKLSWGKDLLRKRIDTVRGGFNSDARVSRAVVNE